MSKRTLVVYVPAINTTTDAWSPLVSRLRRDPGLSNCEWKPWDHNCKFLSFGSAMAAASRLRDSIDAEWVSKKGYQEIILVGHSLGGLLLRQAYLLASGQYENEPASLWQTKVKRVVLLAAINRGLNLGILRVRLYDWLTRSLRVLCFGRQMLAQDLMRGSEFITDLRLHWMSFMRQLSEDDRPMVFQILGERDGVVSRKDSIDLQQFPNAYHIPIPGTRHKDLPLVSKGPDFELRYKFIRDAIQGERLDRAEPPKSREEKEHVVFVLHGIRAANRGWVQELKGLIENSLPNPEVVSLGYGYLSALEFAFPFLHRRPIRMFQNKYSNYFAINPKAQFHFVGHSNGTYILGRSLLALTGMRFDNVVLAGSVLPRDYPWHRLLKTTSQLKALRNDQADRDYPVGLLCAGLRGLGRKDVGVGGYEGFYEDDSSVVQNAFYDRGHSAALESTNLRSIVDFLARGTAAVKPTNLVGGGWSFGLLSRLAPWIFRVLALGIAGLAVVAVVVQSVGAALGLLVGLVALAFLLKII